MPGDSSMQQDKELQVALLQLVMDSREGFQLVSNGGHPSDLERIQVVLDLLDARDREIERVAFNRGLIWAADYLTEKRIAQENRSNV